MRQTAGGGNDPHAALMASTAFREIGRPIGPFL